MAAVRELDAANFSGCQLLDLGCVWIPNGLCFFSCMPSASDIRVGAMSGLMYGGIGLGVWYFAH
jgi:hypothetical protein